MWEIPAERMKMRNAHIVPLSRQVIVLLREQKEETGHLNTNWVLPSQIQLNKKADKTARFFVKTSPKGLISCPWLFLFWLLVF